MTSDNAIPQLTEDVPGAPRELTRVYFDDGLAFGTPIAAPRTDGIPVVWSDTLVTQAAEVGSRRGSDLTTDAIEHVCRRYLGLERRVAALSSELAGERLESVRLARLHAELSRQLGEVLRLYRALCAENIQLRRRLTLDVAFDRAAQAVTGRGAIEVDAELAEQTLRFPAQAEDDRFEDTVVADVEGGER